MAAKDSHINPTFAIAILSGLSIMLNSQAIAKNIKAAIDAPLFIYFLLLDFDQDQDRNQDRDREPDIDQDRDREPDIDQERDRDQDQERDRDQDQDRGIVGL